MNKDLLFMSEWQYYPSVWMKCCINKDCFLFGLNELSQWPVYPSVWRKRYTYEQRVDFFFFWIEWTVSMRIKTILSLCLEEVFYKWRTFVSFCLNERVNDHFTLIFWGNDVWTKTVSFLDQMNCLSERERVNDHFTPLLCWLSQLQVRVV